MDLTAVATGNAAWRTVTKVTLMPLLLLCVVLRVRFPDSAGALVMAALALSAGGDVTLLGTDDASSCERHDLVRLRADCLSRFESSLARPFAPFVVMLTYTAAQALIAAGLIQAQQKTALTPEN